MKLDGAQQLMDEQAISIDVLLEKYAKGDEKTADEVRRRVARALAQAESPDQRAHWEQVFFEAMAAGFIPGGRVNSAAGTDIAATLVNCFVQPVGDAITQTQSGLPSIYGALAQAAETMRRGGGVGYDFSAIRPKGAWVAGTHSRASGPLSYMRVFDKSCETLESAGARRGAQMGMLRCDHPDIEEFIHAKRDGSLSNFNMSVAVTDAFMRAVEHNESVALWHAVRPFAADEAQRDERGWIYRWVNARALFDQIMQSTYNHAEPGVVFIDRVNEDNNLSYCESICATNPCGEQPLPAYGCCCLGSINLTRFVRDAFSEQAVFEFERFVQVVSVAVRALDNVLQITLWPLPEQKVEADRKRRVGLGFTGLGNTLTQLNLRYDSPEGRAMASKIAQAMRDAAYEASCDLAQEKGPFPLFDAEPYLAAPHTASRLPEALKQKIRALGMRNSHVLSIAPTGTISLAFADNASGGIEPTFSWTYVRKKRMPDGSKQAYVVEDHAYRLFRHLGGDTAHLPRAFVHALEMSASDHMQMIAAVQPFVDAAVSKTVNVPEDYPFEQFRQLYVNAWKAGLKGITTYRPNQVIGSVLEVGGAAQAVSQSAPQDLTDDPDRRVRLDFAPQPALASLKWPGRPDLAEGNLAWTYMLDIAQRNEQFAIFVGQVEGAGGGALPFEVWVNGAEQPRGLGAIAKTLSMDMRSEDRAWLKLKLDALAKVRDEEGFQVAMPPAGELCFQNSVVAAFAAVVRWRCEQLGVFQDPADQLVPLPTPVMDALFSKKEPKTGPLGTMSWTVDVSNANTGDDFVLGVKELHLPDGSRRPYSIWLAGEYPKVLDGLCKLISLDMRVVDANWIGLKLKKLLNFGEQNGEFWAPVPGEGRAALYSSTVAYIATLLLHRYKVLGLLDDEGRAIQSAGILALPGMREAPVSALETQPIKGKVCPACHAAAMIKRDGCEFCTACGYTGQCG